MGEFLSTDIIKHITFRAQAANISEQEIQLISWKGLVNK